MQWNIVNFILIIFCITCSDTQEDYYVCSGPPVESPETFKNCRPFNGYYPTTLVTCVSACRANINLRCNSDRNWYPLDENYLSCFNKPITRSDKTCIAPLYEDSICPNLKTHIFYHNEAVTVCYCKSSCQYYQIKCNGEIGSWNKPPNPCSGTGFKNDGILQIHFVEHTQIFGTYSYSCSKGYQLQGEENITCRNGVFQGQVPTCTKSESTTASTTTSMIHSTSEPKECSKIPHEDYICPDESDTLLYDIGHMIQCFCKTNCKNFTLQCLGDERWLNIFSQHCNASLNYIDEGYYDVLYTDNSQIYKCKNSSEEKELPCIDGKLQGDLPKCIQNNKTAIEPGAGTSKKPNNSKEHNEGRDIDIATKREPTSSQESITKILYIVIGILGFLSLCLIVYFIYTTYRKRRTAERRSTVALELQENEYDYPVFEHRNNVQQEEGMYDYAVFPENVQSHDTREAREYEIDNELYQSVDARRD